MRLGKCDDVKVKVRGPPRHRVLVSSILVGHLMCEVASVQCAVSYNWYRRAGIASIVGTRVRRGLVNPHTSQKMTRHPSPKGQAQGGCVSDPCGSVSRNTYHLYSRQWVVWGGYRVQQDGFIRWGTSGKKGGY